MSVYFIANIDIKDYDEYQKYLDKAGEVFARYKGEYLAVDNNPLVLEGEWDYTRTVIISFPDEKELRRWYESKEYQEILQYRIQAARCDTIVVRG